MVVDHELNELKKEFLQEAADKTREIESMLTVDLSSQTLDRLAYLAHQLKGSGGSYGYQRISDNAAELEKAFESLAGGEERDGLDGVIRENATALTEEIEQQLRELE